MQIQESNAMKLPKVTKSDLTEKVDGFYWFLYYVTGGTSDESRKQAPSASIQLEAQATYIADLLSRAGKLALADKRLTERAVNVPARLDEYRQRYLIEPPNA